MKAEKKSAGRKKIRIGLDFDGVVAYNPFRVVRGPVVFLKKALYGRQETKFLIPTTVFQKTLWSVMHESSVFAAPGINLLREMHESNRYEFHLITARYHFLYSSLYRFLRRYNLEPIFTSITMNVRDEQPHVYKARIIHEKKLHYFVEDNLDIVTSLDASVDTRVYWIYNIFDKNVTYHSKFPYLKKALESIYFTSNK